MQLLDRLTAVYYLPCADNARCRDVVEVITLAPAET